MHTAHHILLLLLLPLTATTALAQRCARRICPEEATYDDLRSIMARLAPDVLFFVYDESIEFAFEYNRVNITES